MLIIFLYLKHLIYLSEPFIVKYILFKTCDIFIYIHLGFLHSAFNCCCYLLVPSVFICPSSLTFLLVYMLLTSIYCGFSFTASLSCRVLASGILPVCCAVSLGSIPFKAPHRILM